MEHYHLISKSPNDNGVCRTAFIREGKSAVQLGNCSEKGESERSFVGSTVCLPRLGWGQVGQVAGHRSQEASHSRHVEEEGAPGVDPPGPGPRVQGEQGAGGERSAQCGTDPAARS